MQKAFIAITLALTLACAFAGYTPTAGAWIKAPVQILADTDSNFTIAANMMLGGMTTSDVNVVAYNSTVPADSKNWSTSSWTAWTKTITTKDLSSSSNTSYAFSAILAIGATVKYGYAYGIGLDNDTSSIPQLWLYQTKLSGSALPRVVITSNTNGTFNPLPLGAGMAAWKNGVFFYYAAATGKVNYTSVTLGGSTMGKEFTFSTTWNDTSAQINCDWGEALSSSQVLCAYTEAGVYKVAVVDFSAGTYIGQGPVAGLYGKTMNCAPYVTDKKYYGLLCRNMTMVNSTAYQTFFVSTNTTTDLVQLGNSTNVYNMSVQSYMNMHQYGPYLAIFYINPSAANTELSYDIWDTYANVQNQVKKTFVNFDKTNSTYVSYTIPQGGMYGLLWNFNTTTMVRSTIFVGQIMGASYLTTVFGALMTIIAGLFLF